MGGLFISISGYRNLKLGCFPSLSDLPCLSQELLHLSDLIGKALGLLIAKFPNIQ